jgi:hypothetical protein
VNQEVGTIEEIQISFEFQTTVNHFQKQLKLNTVNKGFIQEGPELLVLNPNIVCKIDFHTTNIEITFHINKKTRRFFSSGFGT